jgi:hypothetical protein
MKKIYFTILAGALAFTVNAQLSLTKAFNEPVIGNVNSQQGYDSTTVLPKNTGSNQSWNFTGLATSTAVTSTTFIAAASTPSSSLFPGATMAEDDGSGQDNYWKTTATTYELLGFADNAGSAVTFTNSAIAAMWPVTLGYSNTDAYAGTATVSLPGTVNGTLSLNGSGTGTINLPGSITLTNILQLKSTNTMKLVLGTFPLTFSVDVVSTEYSYYHSSQKFAVLTVHYEKQTVNSGSGPTVTDSYYVNINNNVLTGITNMNFDALNYNVYPNPATDAVNIHLTNDKTENVSVIVLNNLGQVIKSAELGNVSEVNYALSTFDLQSGIYYVKTSIGDRSSTKKLIIK